MTAIVSIPARGDIAAPPVDPVADTAWDEDLAAALNVVLADTERQEDRLPIALNRHGQYCTRGIGGWRPHPSYMHAYAAAHAEEVA